LGDWAASDPPAAKAATEAAFLTLSSRMKLIVLQHVSGFSPLRADIC
jgi:hypothetical protein